MFVIFYRIADTTTATRTGGTVSPMPVIENSNHDEEIIPVFVLFVPVPVLFSSVFLCVFLVGKVWMKIRRRK